MQSAVSPQCESLLMKLDANENYLGPSPKVMKRLENIGIKDISQYPCYKELLKILSEENDVNPDNIALTNGADDALRVLITSYLDKNEALISISPTIEMPETCAAIAGAEYRKIDCKEKWKFPQDDFLQKIDEKVKIILFTTPNDPTGDVIPADFIEKTARLYPKKLVIVFEPHPLLANSGCTGLCKIYDNIAIVRSMSADYALAGLRIGYIVSNNKNISAIKKAICPYPVSSIAVIAAKEAVLDKKYQEFLKNENEKAKEYLKNGLVRLGAAVYTSFGNFLLVDFDEKAEKIYEKLAQNGILVKKYETEPLKNHLRITIPSFNAAKHIINVLAPENLFIFKLDGVLAEKNKENPSKDLLLVSTELLAGLNDEKCLYSGRSKEETAAFLKDYGLTGAFSLVITADDASNSAEMQDYTEIEKIKNEIPAQNIYFLGDIAEDMQYAKNSGITGIGVLAPQDKSDGQKDYLYVSGAKYVLNDVNELFSQIKIIKQEQNR